MKKARDIQELIDVGVAIGKLAEKLNEHIISAGKPIEDSFIPRDKAAFRIWSMYLYNLYVVIKCSQDENMFYGSANTARFLLECVADAGYLQNHPSEALKYINNQDRIALQLNQLSKSARYAAFSDESITKIGRLRDITKNRISKVLGLGGYGFYNFLSFYSHPNVAGYVWFDQIERDILTRELYRIVATSLFHFIQILGTIEQLNIDAQEWLDELEVVSASL